MGRSLGMSLRQAVMVSAYVRGTLAGRLGKSGCRENVFDVLVRLGAFAFAVLFASLSFCWLHRGPMIFTHEFARFYTHRTLLSWEYISPV